MDYLDFLVRVTGRSYGEYSAEVISSPAGETVRGTPVPDPLQITALRSKLAAEPSEASLRTLGTLLFETLFTGEVLARLRQAMGWIEERKRGLRVQLQIEPNELSALPWEMLFDPDTEQFLALSHQITLVRRVYAYEQPIHWLQSGQEAVRMLALFPSPASIPPLDVTHEVQVMEEALAPLTSSARVEVTVGSLASGYSNPAGPLTCEDKLKSRPWRCCPKIMCFAP